MRGRPWLAGTGQSLLDARAEATAFLSPEELLGHIQELASNPVLLVEGSTFGDYRILGQIGSGGMGVVYRARDVRLDRQVALKVLPADFARDPQWVARFRREGRAASSLNHPNIVVIHEIGQAGGTWYIANELVEGGTIRDRLARGKLTFREAIDVTIQCASALETRSPGRGRPSRCQARKHHDPR